MKITKSMIKAFKDEMKESKQLRKALDKFINACYEIDEINFFLDKKEKSRLVIFVPKEMPITDDEYNFLGNIINDENLYRSCIISDWRRTFHLIKNNKE